MPPYIIGPSKHFLQMADTNNQLRPSSMADSEKTATPSVPPTMTEEKKGVVETVLPAATAAVDATRPITGDGALTSRPNSAASPAEEEDAFEYPTKWKLAAISIALCLSVFCMALVSKTAVDRRLHGFGKP